MALTFDGDHIDPTARAGLVRAGAAAHEGIEDGVALTALNDGVSQIPLPPAVLLFASGLLGMLRFARRRSGSA